MCEGVRTPFALPFFSRILWGAGFVKFIYPEAVSIWGVCPALARSDEVFQVQAWGGAMPVDFVLPFVTCAAPGGPVRCPRRAVDVPKRSAAAD